MIRRLCKPRRSLINIALFMILVIFCTTSIMIFRKLDESNFLGEEQRLPRKLVAKRNANHLHLPEEENKEKAVTYSEKKKDRHVVNNEKWFRKPYSPNAILKDGILGNYEPKLDMNRTGPGEYGIPLMTAESELKAVDKSSRAYGFNMINSDKISLDRLVNDIRHSECKYWHYPEKLPNASVILVFFNEGWSTFVRTVHSVINMSPPQHLHEVVLVDDRSDKEHLKSQLEEHMSQLYGNKVKIVRNKEREGLIRSRNIGALAATGDVVIFLDAHCECSPNWLPPLLTRIAHDRTIMAAPIIDSIDWTTFAYRSNYGSSPHRGIFEWGFFYKEIVVPKQELDKRKHFTEPYWSPTNAGGLFAIDREYFLLLGTYDPQLTLWGGENYELAFKLWQCGGSSEWVPCSRVGHIYRHFVPDRKFHVQTKLSPSLVNYIRVVETWMDDEFKEYFYTREPQARGFPVDIREQLQFKIDNQCKNFSWFMDNVAYDVYTRFPKPPPNQAWGQIGLRESNGTLCLALGSQYEGSRALNVKSCRSSTIVRLNTKGQIGVGERCIIAKTEHAATLEWCPTADVTGPWHWNQTSGEFYNKKHGKCFAVNSENKLVFAQCDNTSRQKWDIVERYRWK